MGNKSLNEVTLHTEKKKQLHLHNETQEKKNSTLNGLNDERQGLELRNGNSVKGRKSEIETARGKKEKWNDLCF